MTVAVDDVHVGIDHSPRSTDIGMGDQFQVVLYNDNHNTCDHVTRCLMRIFGHSSAMAEKLMMEAHQTGRTIAQVEDREPAILHNNQLKAAGLKAEIETF